MKIVQQFVKYSGVAASSAAIDWVLYSALVFLGLHFVTAQVISRLTGGIYAFFVNKYFSFGLSGHSRVSVEGRRFLILYMFSYGLSLTLLWILGSVVGFNIFVAKLIADGSCLIINFIVMRGYVFHPRTGIIGRLRAFVHNF